MEKNSKEFQELMIKIMIRQGKSDLYQKLISDN